MMTQIAELVFAGGALAVVGTVAMTLRDYAGAVGKLYRGSRAAPHVPDVVMLTPVATWPAALVRLRLEVRPAPRPQGAVRGEPVPA